MIQNKHILAIDFIILFGSLVLLVGTVGYVGPLVISPIDNLTTTNSSILFSFDKGDTILIDDNLEFSSPMTVNVDDDIVINLKPGNYYWKVGGVFESGVRQLTIKSSVELKIKQGGESYEVVNAGNVDLDVEFFEEGRFLRKDKLKVDKSKDIEGDEILGRENE